MGVLEEFQHFYNIERTSSHAFEKESGAPGSFSDGGEDGKNNTKNRKILQQYDYGKHWDFYFYRFALRDI